MKKLLAVLLLLASTTVLAKEGVPWTDADCLAFAKIGMLYAEGYANGRPEEGNKKIIEEHEKTGGISASYAISARTLLGFIYTMGYTPILFG